MIPEINIMMFLSMTKDIWDAIHLTYSKASNASRNFLAEDQNISDQTRSMFHHGICSFATRTMAGTASAPAMHPDEVC